jgi:hypothetical protein
MLLSCPSCSFRNDFAAPDQAVSSPVECAACGHVWIEPRTEEDKTRIDEPKPTVQSNELRSPEPEIRRLVTAARDAERRFAEHRRKQRLTFASWIGLGLLALSPVACALAFPERLVATVPASIDVYRTFGHEVNLYGLEIRKLEVQHFLMDGKKVIAVKGELTNISSELRRIPWLRFGLRDETNTELYHWVLDTEARPLKPGDSTSFITRLASPPFAAEHLEIRFAHADEIGSNDRL